MGDVTTPELNSLATKFATDAPYGLLLNGTPATDGSATNEISGLDREALTWGSASGGVVTSAATDFSVSSGADVKYFGAAASADNGTDDVKGTHSVTEQSFSSDGTYTVTATYTQT